MRERNEWHWLHDARSYGEIVDEKSSERRFVSPLAKGVMAVAR